MDSELVDWARALPLEQRVQLIDTLWESVAQEGYEPPLTPQQADELDRRLAAHRRNPDDVIPWESIMEEFNQKYR
ncbi:MAG TPA: addiction module protein [Pyrinomonadaceae bacterium]|jgi:putative addiction module component (TIGR02574 family)|nr:addiction module protein [Pyrinomonadaceae bacterium]